MQIKAKVALSLPNKYYKITLKYDTFQKATWDQYFIASLVYNTNYESDAHVYINEITGNGSLNQHFKILYDEIIKMEPELDREEIFGQNPNIFNIKKKR